MNSYLYITNSNINLVSYHAYKLYSLKPIVIEAALKIDLLDSLVKGSIVNYDITTASFNLKPSLYVIEYLDDAISIDSVDSVYQAEGSIIYLCVDNTNKWRDLTKKKSWVKIISVNPEIYKNILLEKEGLFTKDALEYFWNELCLGKFKSNPVKWEMEIEALSVKASIKKEKITAQNLQDLYENFCTDTINSYLNYFASNQSRKYLILMNSKELWNLFLNPFSRLYKHLLQIQAYTLYYSLSYLQSSIRSGRLSTRSAIVIWNEWLIWIANNEKKSAEKSGKTSLIDLEIKSEKISELRRLLCI